MFCFYANSKEVEEYGFIYLVQNVVKNYVSSFELKKKKKGGWRRWVLLVKTLFGCLENGVIPFYAVVMVLFLIAELVESVALISICLHCLN